MTSTEAKSNNPVVKKHETSYKIKTLRVHKSTNKKSIFMIKTKHYFQKDKTLNTQTIDNS